MNRYVFNYSGNIRHRDNSVCVIYKKSKKYDISAPNSMTNKTIEDIVISELLKHRKIWIKAMARKRILEIMKNKKLTSGIYEVESGEDLNHLIISSMPKSFHYAINKSIVVAGGVKIVRVNKNQKHQGKASIIASLSDDVFQFKFYGVRIGTYLHEGFCFPFPAPYETVPSKILEWIIEINY